MKARFYGSKQHAGDIWTFYFKPEEPVDYIAGQFTELHLPHTADNRGDKRWFTLSSSPSEELLSVTTRISPDGSSFKRALSSLRPGTDVHMAEPMGDFVLPKSKSTPLLFVARGIGITPYRSIVKSLVDHAEKRDIHLIYSVRNKQAAVFKKELVDYGLKLDLLDTKLTADKIIKLHGSEPILIYLAGPEEMVEELKNDLQNKGLAANRIVADFFHGYGTIA